MFTKWFRLIAVMVAMLVVVGVVAAFDDQGDTNDPTVNERANACYEDGSMAGKCDTDLEWAAGWYLIRFEYGLFTREQVPAWVAWVLPPEVVPEDLVEDTLALPPIDTCTATGNFGTTYNLYIDWGTAYPAQANLILTFNGAPGMNITLDPADTFSKFSKDVGATLTSMTATLVDSSVTPIAFAECVITNIK